MWEPARFLLFSSIETMSAFALMLAIVRIKVKDYIWPGLFMSLLMNLQSYLLRSETSVAALSQGISIILFALLLITVVKIPALWSFGLSLVVTFIYTIIQFTMLKTLFAGVNTSTLSTSWEGSALQLTTSIVVIGVTYFLLKFKIGFTREFDKFRFYWLHISMMCLLVCALIGSMIMFYMNDLNLLILHMIVMTGMLLYYAVKKEREED